MSDSLVAVNITKRVDASDRLGTQFTSYIAGDATLADLRVVLLDDEVMDGNDKFFVNNRALGKSSEAKIKWADALKNGEIVVVDATVVATEATPIPQHVSAREGFTHATADAALSTSDQDSLAQAKSLVHQDNTFAFEDLRRVHELTDVETRILLKNSRLGAGIDIRDADGPRPSGLPVVADVGIDTVHFVDTEQGGEEVIVSYSARAAAYAKSGWAKLALSASSPFVSGSLEASVEFSSTGSSSSSTVSVTGRYMYSMCQATFLGELKPHPELKKAVDKALSAEPASRTARLQEVFSRFGHVYVASVEMGGMKHTTSTTTNTENTSKQTFEAEMKLALAKKFGPASKLEGSVGGGVRTENSSTATSRYENETFTTVGGITQENDITRWKASLANPYNWSVTRTIRVEPVIDLFDKETQDKILAAAPSIRKAEPITFETGSYMTVVPFQHDNPSTIRFASRTGATPDVLLGLKYLDFARDRNLRIRADVQQKMSDAANLSLVSWADTVLYGSSFNWLQVPSSSEEFQHGQFDTEPQPETTQWIPFPHAYNEPPKVVAWLHGLDTSSDTDIRITVWVDGVTKDGFTLHVSSWDGSRTYRAWVTWFAHPAWRTDIISGTYSTRDIRPPQQPQSDNTGYISFAGTQFANTPRVFTAIRGANFDRFRNPRLNLTVSEVTPTGMKWHASSWADTILYIADMVYIAF